MINHKLIGFVVISIYAVAILLIVIGCLNFTKTGLCISLVALGIFLAYINESLIDAVKEANE